MTNVLVFCLGDRLFGRRIATAGVAALIVIEQVSFVRHYTTALLSENLYFLTVALTLYLFVRFAERPERRMVVWCGIAAGFSALTRPAMMMFLVPSTAIVVWISARAVRQWRPAAATGAIFVAAWLATISPATLRNYIVGGSPVLIAQTRLLASINYTLPPGVDGDYYRNHYMTGTLAYVRFLVDMFVHYPHDTLLNFYVKTGFSLGLIQWMGGRLHPELVLASAGYLLAVAWIPDARRYETWPIHAFVVTHLVGLVLMMPSVYGYRLILPMYLFFPLFAARAAAELGRRARRWV